VTGIKGELGGMKIQIGHPITSYLDAINQLLAAQGEDFQTIGATSLTDVSANIEKESAEVSVIDAVLLHDQPPYKLAGLVANAPYHPLIILLDETENQLISDLQSQKNVTLLFKTKGYLSSLADAIRDSHSRRTPKPAQSPAQTTSTSKTPSLAGEGYFICDRRGRFLSANKSLQTLTRYSEDEILELSLSDLLNKAEEQTFFQRIFDENDSASTSSIPMHLIDKIGNSHPVFLNITMLHDESREQRIIGFRGAVVARAGASSEEMRPTGPIDQNIMVQHLLDLVQMSYTEPINVLLKRIGEVVCQVFGFTRSTVALLDRRKKTYVKHALVGYSESVAHADGRPLDVPQDVVDRLFIDKNPVKIIYYNQELVSSEALHNPQSATLQPFKNSQETQWHPRDLVLLRLADHNGGQFGFVSIDEPLDEMTPTSTTFYNLELFSMLVSMVIENYYRYSTLDRRNRRLKQVMVNSNIFKLYLSLSELLREVVWSVKFSLEFNLVALVLISKKTGQLETKAVACDDKIKLSQISELAYDLKDFSMLLRDEYHRGKSFLISTEEPVLRHFKQIYYGNLTNGHYQDGWPRYALLMVPIKSREGKIIGFIMVDDPADGRMPTTESVSILEILANQVAIAIDNRMLYIQGKEAPQSPPVAEMPEGKPEESKEIEETATGLRRLVDRFLR